MKMPWICYYSDLNRTYAERMQRGFQQASAEILQMFEKESEEATLEVA